jgi:hypothetical protein
MEMCRMAIGHLQHRFKAAEIPSILVDKKEKKGVTGNPLAEALPTLTIMCSAFPMLTENAVNFLLGKRSF